MGLYFISYYLLHWNTLFQLPFHHKLIDPDPEAYFLILYRYYNYFLGLKKQRQIKKSINELIDENNEQITDQRHILSAIKSYYEKLYTTKYPDENLTRNYNIDTKLENSLGQLFVHCFHLLTRLLTF
jgi:hypothetical protein